jgi:hypothetical protein
MAQDAKSLRVAPVPKGGFYVGAGGSFNWDGFDQALEGVSGVTNVFIGPNLVANGQAGGPFHNYDRDETAFAPDVQAGYFETFGGGVCRAASSSPTNTRT